MEALHRGPRKLGEVGKSLQILSTKATSTASIATWELLPIATPRSARVEAGASLTPSPTTPSGCASFFSRKQILSPGLASATAPHCCVAIAREDHRLDSQPFDTIGGSISPESQGILKIGPSGELAADLHCYEQATLLLGFYTCNLVLPIQTYLPIAMASR